MPVCFLSESWFLRLCEVCVKFIEIHEGNRPLCSLQSKCMLLTDLSREVFIFPKAILLRFHMNSSRTFFFKDFIYLFMRDTEREREREAETQAEGEAGSMQGAQCGTQSWVSRIRLWAEGGTKPLSHRGCPYFLFYLLYSLVIFQCIVFLLFFLERISNLIPLHSETYFVYFSIIENLLDIL